MSPLLSNQEIAKAALVAECLPYFIEGKIAYRILKNRFDVSGVILSELELDIYQDFLKLAGFTTSKDSVIIFV